MSQRGDEYNVPGLIALMVMMILGIIGGFVLGMVIG